MIDLNSLWTQAVSLHGCECPALAVGVRAVAYVMEKFELPQHGPYPVVCTAESFCCGIDAVQALLGCTTGNAKLRIQNKKRMAFRFCNCKTQRSVSLQLVAQLKAGPDLTRQVLAAPIHELFAIRILDETPTRAPNSFLSSACPLRSPEGPGASRQEPGASAQPESGALTPPHCLGYDRDW